MKNILQFSALPMLIILFLVISSFILPKAQAQQIQGFTPVYGGEATSFYNNMGFRFTPTTNGYITAFWCYNSAPETVYLWRNAVGTKLITSATVNCNSIGWASTVISPTYVAAGTSYTISGDGTNYYAIIPAATYGNIQVSGGEEGATATYPNIGTGSVVGLVDITFSPSAIPPTPTPTITPTPTPTLIPTPVSGTCTAIIQGSYSGTVFYPGQPSDSTSMSVGINYDPASPNLSNFSASWHSAFGALCTGTEVANTGSVVVTPNGTCALGGGTGLNFTITGTYTPIITGGCYNTGSGVMSATFCALPNQPVSYVNNLGYDYTVQYNHPSWQTLDAAHSSGSFIFRPSAACTAAPPPACASPNTCVASSSCTTGTTSDTCTTSGDVCCQPAAPPPPPPPPPPIVDAWWQAIGLDVRDDTGLDYGSTSYSRYYDPIPTGPVCPAYGLLPGSGGDPGVLFTGNTDPITTATGTTDRSKISSTEWNVGGSAAAFSEQYKAFNASNANTSFAAVSARLKEAGIQPTLVSSGSFSGPLSTFAILPGAYLINGDTTFIGPPFTFPAGNYIILVKGNLLIQSQILVPKTSTALFSVQGDITVDKSVGDVIP